MAPPSAWRRLRPPVAAAPSRPPAVLVGLLSVLALLVGWAFSASYAPGLAPRGLVGAAARLTPVPVACRPPVCPLPPASAVGVASNGRDMLVLLEPTVAPQPPARIVVTLEGPPRRVVLEATGTPNRWRTTLGTGAPRTVGAAIVGRVAVVRLPGQAPAGRWMATVGTVRVPRTGLALVTEPARLRDVFAPSSGERRGNAFVLGAVAVLVVLIHAHVTARRRSLRAALRSVLYLLFLLLGVPRLTAQLEGAPPGLIAAATIVLVPFAALAIAAVAAWALSVPMRRHEASSGLQAATAGAALLLALALGFSLDAVAARLVPGLTI